MQDQPSNIYHVSDTALLIAAYRTMETKRLDSIFQDPLALLLTGDRGEKIAKKMKARSHLSWLVTVRTSAIDRMLLSTIKNQNIDTVVNLGSGLDTRPYRLDLPSNINWFEIDFPNIIAYKNQVLKNNNPKCNLKYFELDLSLQEERMKVFSFINSSAKKILILSEGLILYLKEEEVKLLSRDLLSFPNFEFWLQDYYSTNYFKLLPRRWKENMKSSPFQFFPKDWFDFFSEYGWNKNEFISSLEEGKKIGRPTPFPINILFNLFSKLSYHSFQNLCGVVLFSRKIFPEIQ